MHFKGPHESDYTNCITNRKRKISETIVEKMIQSGFFAGGGSNIINKEARPRRKDPAAPVNERPNYWNSKWGKMLIRDKAIMLEQPQGKTAKIFRRRFRVPPRLFFDVIVPEAEKVFQYYADDRFETYRFQIPVEIKVLIVLRILGRDACADDCVELSDVSETSCNRIFLKFLEAYPRMYYDKYVYFPEPGSDELANIMETYRLLAFPGCVGSIDATHIKWEKCPKEWKWCVNIIISSVDKMVVLAIAILFFL